VKFSRSEKSSESFNKNFTVSLHHAYIMYIYIYIQVFAGLVYICVANRMSLPTVGRVKPGARSMYICNVM